MSQGLQGVAGKGRYFAMGIDNTLAAACALFSASLVPLPDRGNMVVAITVFILYFFLQEGAWSTTLGKRLFGLQVRRIDGSKCGWTGAALRTAARALEVNPILPFGALPGAIVVARTKRRQRIGDLLAGTVVLKAEVTAGSGE